MEIGKGDFLMLRQFFDAGTLCVVHPLSPAKQKIVNKHNSDCLSAVNSQLLWEDFCLEERHCRPVEN